MKFDAEQLKKDGGHCITRDKRECYAVQLPSGRFAAEDAQWINWIVGAGGNFYNDGTESKDDLFNLPRKVKVYVFEGGDGRLLITLKPGSIVGGSLWGTAEITEGEGL